jgi:hypothetical protein
MRTTITLAPDVSAAVEHAQRERGVGVSEVVNDLVRRGLAATPERPPFRQTTSDLGRARLPVDDVAGLLDVLEGDDRRS